MLTRTYVHRTGAASRLLYKELGRVCCSGGLERQLRRLGSDVHVFGHTHINWDKTHNGVRYVQHPLKVRNRPAAESTAASACTMWLHWNHCTTVEFCCGAVLSILTNDTFGSPADAKHLESRV